MVTALSIQFHHAHRPSYRKFSCFLFLIVIDTDSLRIVQDITAAEQVSLHHLTVTVPELSPSDTTPSNASSPSSSVPVTPLDPPPFVSAAAAQADPLVHGKHQPDPRPLKPVSRGLGTVWRARQVLLGLGKRKRRASADIGGVSTGVELLTDDYYDVPELPDSNSAPEITVEPRPSQVNLP